MKGGIQGIVFNLIIIRVAMGVSAESTDGDRTGDLLGLGRLRGRGVRTGSSGVGTLTEMVCITCTSALRFGEPNDIVLGIRPRLSHER